MSDITQDAFLNGRLRISQPRQGYRFSIDAALLASAVQPKAGERGLDLGAGCGIVSLIIAVRHPGTRIYAVEVQPELATVAEKNVIGNRLEEAIEVVHLDMALLPTDRVRAPVDWIVSNPPYRRTSTGRINPNDQKAVARHEIKVDLATLLATARRMLRKGGRFFVVYAAERITDLLMQMRLADIEPKTLRAVHGRVDETAKLVLVGGLRGGRQGLSMLSPLVVYRRDGQYSRQVEAMLV
ncbi:MAG: methyltransferase [Desulfatitalea sp.]|nr:methyltransferase [Desulfatitalea sp.]